MQLKRRPSRRVLVLTGVAVVAAVGGTTWWVTRSEPAAAQAATMTVTRETFKDTVSATGTVEPARQADLSFTVPGTVTGVRVQVGDRVRKGDVLATVDDSLLGSEVTARESALDAAETRLDDDEDADASDTQLSADRAAVVNAESQLEQAKQSLADATLRSTIDGTVAAVNLEKGDTAGQQGGDAAAQFTVVAPRRFKVEAQVATGDIDRVKKGLQVEITPTGGTEPVFGTVTNVGRIATAQDNGAATFPVTIDVTGKRKDVYAGSSATLEIIVRQVDDVLAVPSMALRQDDKGTYVYKQVNGKRVKTRVQTGETFGPSTQVIDGVAEGDVVEVISFSRTSGGNRDGGQMPGLPPGAVVFEQSGPDGGSGVKIEAPK